jgi:hypothetical protein
MATDTRKHDVEEAELEKRLDELEDEIENAEGYEDPNEDLANLWLAHQAEDEYEAHRNGTIVYGNEQE